jgi:hypothetical protein
VTELRHLVVDVQIVMTGAGMTDPPDDGACRDLLMSLRDVRDARLVWDTEALIRSQYENKLRKNAFAWEWIQDLMVRSKVIEVPRCRLTRPQSQKIRATGLVGEDLMYYVRTAANSPDRHLVSHDSDFDAASCRVLVKQLDVVVTGATSGDEFLVLGNEDTDEDSQAEP